VKKINVKVVWQKLTEHTEAGRLNVVTACVLKCWKTGA